jgi:hypothetical protein
VAEEVLNMAVAIAVTLMAFGGLIAFGNWWNIYWTYHTKRFHSPVPLLGAALLGMGMFILSATRPYCWTALVLDYGTLALLFASPRIVREAWGTSRFNLVSEYLGKTGVKTAWLRLFRRGIFTIRLELHRQPGEYGLISTGTVGTWQREGKSVTLSTGQESAIFDVMRDAPKETLHQSVGFPGWERSHDHSLANIDFVQT